MKLKLKFGTKALQTKSPYLLLLIIGVVVALPVILVGFPYGSDDSAYHVLWYKHFSEQILAGDVYPRWLMGMNGGLGSPSFFYYPPLSYYFTFLLEPFFSGDEFRWRQLGVSAMTALIASGICAYVWLKKLTNNRAARGGAIIYMVAPYHIAIDLYVRGAFAELWAFVWMPLTLHCVNEIRDDQRRAVIWLALVYAALITTHLPTTLIFSPVIIGYAVFLTDSRHRMRVAVLTSVALVLGIGVSAIYLIPALTMQDFVMMRAMQTDYFDYRDWFLFTLYISPKLKAKLTWIVVGMMVLIGCVLYFIRQTQTKESKFWLATSAVSIFLMTPLSIPAWQFLPLLNRVQFPWRFNTVLVVATAALVAFGVQSFKKPLAMMGIGAATIALLFVASWMPVTAWAAYRNLLPPDITREGAQGLRDRLAQYRDASEYQPMWVAMKSPPIEARLKNFAQNGESTQRATIVEGAGSVVVTSWQPRVIVLAVESQSGMKLVVDQFYFPLWVAYRDGDAANIVPVQPSRPEGLLMLDVPGGSHSMTLELQFGVAERIGMAVSFGSLMLMVVLGGWLRYAGRRRIVNRKIL